MSDLTEFGPLTFAKLPRCRALNDRHEAQGEALELLFGKPGNALKEPLSQPPMTGMLNLLGTQTTEWQTLAMKLEAELILKTKCVNAQGDHS